MFCLEVRKHEINCACAFHNFIRYFKIQTQLMNLCSLSLLFHQPYLMRPGQTGAALAEWLSSWLAEQEDRGSIPRLAT